MPTSNVDLYQNMPEPLTQEQLDQISRETRKASEKAAARVRSSALVGFLILLIGIGVVYNVGQSRNDDQRQAVRKLAAQQAEAVARSGRAVAVEGCNRDFNSISALRASYESARRLTEAAAQRGEISPHQLAVSRKFYDDQLAKLVLPDCRLAASSLTSNPEEPVVVPTPLYPGMPRFNAAPGP